MSKDFSNAVAELSPSQFNAWKLLEFLLNERSTNPDFDLYHFAIFAEMIRLSNISGWSDTFGIPTDFTAHRLLFDIKTYRIKKKELQQFGMVIELEPGKKNAAPVMSLKTEKFKAFVISNYIKSKSEKKMPTHRKGRKDENAYPSQGGSFYPHIKQKGGEPLLREDKPTATAPLERTPADGENRSEGRYSRYGLPDTLIPTFKSHLHEQEVEADTVGRILSSSESTDVVTSVIKNNPEQNLQREDVERAIKVLVSFLKDNPSREADETIKALTLTPDEKARQKEERLTQ